jgi:hypothetical protein
VGIDGKSRRFGFEKSSGRGRNLPGAREIQRKLFEACGEEKNQG